MSHQNRKARYKSFTAVCTWYIGLHDVQLGRGMQTSEVLSRSKIEQVKDCLVNSYNVVLTSF